VETERDAKRRQLHEKDQELQSLQRKSEHNRTTAEERKRALERKDDEHKNHIAEVQRLKTQVDLLQERANASDRRVKLAERESRQQERRLQEQEAVFMEHVAVLEESLRREEARRRALEVKVAHAEVARDTHAKEVETLTQHKADLDRKVAELEGELQQFGEATCSALRSEVTASEEKVEATKRELEEERDRSEDLERRYGALQQRINILETGPDGAETLKLKLADKEVATAPAPSIKSGIGERTPLEAPQETEAEQDGGAKEVMPTESNDIAE